MKCQRIVNRMGGIWWKKGGSIDFLRTCFILLHLTPKDGSTSTEGVRDQAAPSTPLRDRWVLLREELSESGFRKISCPAYLTA